MREKTFKRRSSYCASKFLQASFLTFEKRRVSKSVKIFFALSAVVVLLFCVVAFFGNEIAFASTEADKNIEAELKSAVDDIIGRLDTDAFDSFLKSLDEEQKSTLSFDSIKDMLKSLTAGASGNFFQNFLEFLSSSVGKYFAGFLPSFITIIVICLLKNMLSGMTSNFLNNSTTEVVHVVCYSAIIVVLMTGVVTVIKTVLATIEQMSTFSMAVFPPLLTMLSMLGGASSVAIYQPFMAVLSSSIIKLIISFIVPAFIATIVFSVVGNISKNVKLDKLTKLIKSVSTWVLGIVFGLFATFLTMQGITGGVVDKFGFNAAKFALSSYVPVLGGYLSDGFDLLSTSMVLVKNAFGFTGVLALLALVMFPLLKLVVFVLALRLTSA
ncbi:MAG: stage III sporulation protein AE, partial [Clostridia bacterium]